MGVWRAKVEKADNDYARFTSSAVLDLCRPVAHHQVDHIGIPFSSNKVSSEIGTASVEVAPHNLVGVSARQN